MSPLPRFPGLPAHRLEAYLCGEVDAAERARIEALLAELPEARAFVEERRGDKQAFRERYPFTAIEARLQAKPAAARRWLVWLPVPLMAAAVVVLLALPEEPTIRARGGISVTLVAKRGERTFEASQGVALLAGDRLRLRLDDPRGGFVQVAALSERGRSSVLYEGAVGRGATVLPDSWELDAEPVREVLLVLLWDEPPSSGALESWLEVVRRVPSFPPAPEPPSGARLAVVPILKDLP